MAVRVSLQYFSCLWHVMVFLSKHVNRYSALCSHAVKNGPLLGEYLPKEIIMYRITFECLNIDLVISSFIRVSTTPGNLLEFTGPPGNFCVR